MVNVNAKMNRFEFQVSENHHRMRLDNFLFDRFTQFSKAYLRSIVKNGLCEVNGYLANSGLELRENDFVEVRIETGKAKAMQAQEMPIEVVYEDDAIMVVEKQHGILVHPTHYERDGTLLNGLTYYLNHNQGGGASFVRPHLVHRLDRETSGLLVLAKTVEASGKLCRQIKKQAFLKRYIALVKGNVSGERGEIDAPIARSPELKRHLVHGDGKPCKSRYEVIKKGEIRTQLMLEPVSGRTNQLRIHCAHIGHPIVGDDLYGGPDHDRLCLHASELGFRHPKSNEPLIFTSIEPSFLQA